MVWFFALIGAVGAYILNENFFIWGIFGYVAGMMLDIPERIKTLEKKITQLQQDISALKNPSASNTVESSPSESAFKPKQPSTSAPWEPHTDSYQPVERPLTMTTSSRQYEGPQTDTEAIDPLMQESDAATTPTPYSRFPAPSDLQKLITLVVNWFTDGNTFVRVGIVILFIGVSFLLNFAIDQGMISIELRLVGVALAAIALLAIGWKLRSKKTAYALLIQGGGVGLLYLTIFASFSMFDVIPSLVAFILLILVITLATTLAILENALSLALFAAIGGFLAPILTSTGSNNYLGLFSFYALLNAGIFAVAWFRSWRILNLVGFVFTFSISTFWGANHYQPAFFAHVEPFLILFFLFYVGIAILYALKRAPDFKDSIDGTLLFGTPILAFGLQAAMVNRYEYGVAISAFSLGVFYLLLAGILWRRLGHEMKALSETFLAISVIFATLAIPFAVDDTTTSAAWAIEGTGVLWVSIRQQQYLRRLFALMLQLFAGWMLYFAAPQPTSIAFFNSTFIGTVLITICAGLSSWMLYQPFDQRRNLEKNLSPWLLTYGLLWLFSGYEYQIDLHQLHNDHVWLLLSLTLIVGACCNQSGKRLDWLHCRYAALTMLLPMVYATLVTLALSSHPSAHFGWLLWPLVLSLYFKILKDHVNINPELINSLHLLTGLLLVLLLFWEGFWQLLLITSLLSLLFYKISSLTDWPQMRVLAFGLLPVMILLIVAILFSEPLHPFYLPDNSMGVEWPFAAGYVLWPLAFVVMYWLFNQEDRQTAPLSHLSFMHALALWLLVLIPTWEASWHLSFYLPFSNDWHRALLPVTSILALWLIMKPRFWPFNRHSDTYLRLAAPPIAWALVIGSVLALRSAGDSSPLPWLPILNPADIIQVIILLTLVRYIALISVRTGSATKPSKWYWGLSAFTFVWLNIVLLRCVHHWGGIPWSGALLSTPLAQTSLSIFWALSGLVLTIISNQLQLRKLWISGAVLLAIVVIKLFLLDLAAHDSIERIISFITVGALLMLIGYFAPLPATREKQHVP